MSAELKPCPASWSLTPSSAPILQSPAPQNHPPPPTHCLPRHPRNPLRPPTPRAHTLPSVRCASEPRPSRPRAPRIPRCLHGARAMPLPAQRPSLTPRRPFPHTPLSFGLEDAIGAQPLPHPWSPRVLPRQPRPFQSRGPERYTAPSRCPWARSQAPTPSLTPTATPPPPHLGARRLRGCWGCRAPLTIRLRLRRGSCSGGRRARSGS